MADNYNFDLGLEKHASGVTIGTVQSATHSKEGIAMKTKSCALTVLVLSLLLMWQACPGSEATTGTFSIVGHDSITGEIGVAVQSKAFGVGAAVAWAEAGVGAIATQASTNESFGPKGLELLRAGLESQQVLDLLLEADPGREDRQLAVIDVCGHGVNFTGSRCLVWAGGRTGPGYACQGNILAEEEVVEAMAQAFEITEGQLAERLLAALVAAQAAGGDRRGMQSAAILVVRPSDDFPEYRYRYVDLRVEDHLDPINELIRVYRIHEATGLLEAHVRYAEHHQIGGEEELAQRERDIVGRLLERVLAEETEDADLLNNLAWFCATADIFLEEAGEAAERAVALKPDEAYIIDTLAEVQFRRGRAHEAIATIQRAIDLDPESVYYKEQLDRFKGN
jgi:uncharacterized Ntn-hydrolase superfamily protein